MFLFAASQQYIHYVNLGSGCSAICDLRIVSELEPIVGRMLCILAFSDNFVESQVIAHCFACHRSCPQWLQRLPFGSLVLGQGRYNCATSVQVPA